MGEELRLTRKQEKIIVAISIIVACLLIITVIVLMIRAFRNGMELNDTIKAIIDVVKQLLESINME